MLRSTSDAGLLFNEICVGTMQAAPVDFTPVRSSHEKDCAILRAARPSARMGIGRPVWTASCVAESGSIVFPCSTGGSMNVSANKYCRPGLLDKPNERVSMVVGCPRTSARLLLPRFEEWYVHPDNINHVGRDLLGLAHMLSLGNRSGYTVMIENTILNSTMSTWGKNVLQALTLRGLLFGDWHEAARRFAASPACVCATAAVRYGNVGNVGGGELLRSAALEHCKLPPHPPARRTLLLVTRKTKTRVLRNLPAVERVLKPFAAKLGLQLAMVNLGSLSFCEQVRHTAEAYIMAGVHGADLMNMVFQHADATLFELYGRGADSAALYAGPTAFMQQLAGAGRRGMAVQLFNVTGCAGSWMYDDHCELRLDAEALVALIREWVPRPPKAWSWGGLFG